MALGGGTFTVQNKVLPGSYINFISAATRSSGLSERGIAALPVQWNWGTDKEVYKITREEFMKDSLKILGYKLTDPQLKGLRDLFQNVHTLYTYNLSGGGTKASNNFGTAKYAGTRGNDLKIVITEDVDNEGMFNVATILDTFTVDEQLVKTAAELEDNDFIVFDKHAELAETASAPLTGASDGEVNGKTHQAFLDQLDRYAFNALGVVTTDDTINKLYENFTREMREDRGIKFQTVLYNTPADYEGVVNLKNKALDSLEEAGLVYWVTGIIAGTPVNESALNTEYNGEFIVDVEYTQADLEASILAGEFVLHQVGDTVRVLNDINSLVTLSEEKTEVFKDNQSVRVIDQIATDIAELFNTRYLGKVPNDASGRVSLQSDIISHHQNLQNIRAIENFNEEDVTVEIGNDKKTVVVNDQIQIVNTMEKLYMSVVVQ